ncbi:hypothetical protein LSCM4_00993 [Leishmania orientalis]|uniref:Uncharacterized protein n=1 Tax=Leishmania orientalis TaxID=2249476 RepID=A0A836FRM5_9TRYP|nr:hypothetical protein LSCM4_00993 [Leishmania orientalis]
MLATRAGFFAASHRRFAWWSRPLQKSDDGPCVPGNAARASLIPDAVIDACMPRRAVPDLLSGACAHWPPTTFASLLLRIPCVPTGQDGRGTNVKGHPVSSPGEVLDMTRLPSEASQARACSTVGSLYNALVDAQHCFLAPPPSLEAFFVSLASFAPLFLNINPTSGESNDIRCDRAEMLLEYCAGTAATPYSTFHPFMRRLIREVRVSWQPWLSSPQIVRLAAAAGDGVGGDSRRLQERVLPSYCGNLTESSMATLCCLPSEGGCSSACAGTLAYARTPQYIIAAEKAWQTLLEHVPSFFVATTLVKASLRRAYSAEKALRLFMSWTSRPCVRVTAALDTAAHAGCEKAPHSNGEDGGCRGPYVEVSPCGAAVRAPSLEQCLQAGCPARLIYNPQHAPAALQERYALLRGDGGLGPGLMHMALAMVCAVVPTSPRPLSVVRQIFQDLQQQQQQQYLHQERDIYSREVAERAGAVVSPAAATAHRGCVRFFPCVEVLLDHPQLAFTVQILDKATGHVCARFPVPCEADTKTATSAGRPQELQVQLHPSFSHARRGMADVALSVLEKMKAMAILAEARRPQQRRDAPFDTSHACAVRFHDARDGLLTESLEAVLQSLERQSAAALTAGSTSVAERVFFVGVNEVGGLGGEAPSRRDASTAVKGERDAQGSPRAVLLITVVRDDSNSVDVVAVEARALCSQLRKMKADCATTPTTAEEQRATAAERLLLPLARALHSPTSVKMLPSSAFTDDSVSCAHRLQQRSPSALCLLLDSLHHEALSGVCRLEHIVHYVGYPVDGTMPLTPGSGADLLLASTIVARYGSAIHTTTAQQECGSDGEFGGSLPEVTTPVHVVHGAATVSLAASLLLQLHPQERQFHMFGNPCGKESAECTAESTLGMTLSCALQRWVLKPALARQHGLALRLARFERWLAHATAGKVDELSARYRGAAVAEARHPSATLAARDGCLSDLEVTLRDLVCRFGPEPLPNRCWMRGPGTEDTRQMKSASFYTDAAAVRVKESETAIPGGSDKEEGSSPPLPAEVPAAAEHLDVDALLHDALTQEAAAIRQAVAKHAQPTTVADADTATSTPPHDNVGLPVAAVGASVDAGSILSLPTPSSPILGAGAAPGSSDPVEEDALQCYLSTLFDESDASSMAETSTPTCSPAAQATPLTSSTPRPEEVATNTETVGPPNVAPSLQSCMTTSDAIDMSAGLPPASSASLLAACDSGGSGRDNAPTATVPPSTTRPLPLGFHHGPSSLMATHGSCAARRLANAKSGADKLNRTSWFPLTPCSHSSQKAAWQGLSPQPNQPASMAKSAVLAPSSPRPPSAVPSTHPRLSSDANIAQPRRFGRFAPWSQPAISTPSQQGSPFSPTSSQRPPLSQLARALSTDHNASTQPLPSALFSTTSAAECSAGSLLPLDPTDAERLHLASLLVDILRGTTKKPRPWSRR